MSYPEWLSLKDADGDVLNASPSLGAYVVITNRQGDGGPLVPVELSRDQVLDLYHFLGDHIMATNNTTEAVTTPDATTDGYTWPEQHESVALEAHHIVHGDRQADYGHPREDFTRQAILWTGLLQHKLADGAFLEPEDIARCMIATKLARDVHSPKRDNRVDMAGYAITLDRLETGQ